jgi:copper oxidase (laccase) domain-containing protein
VVIAEQSRQAGATVTISPWCTRCHNERFFSHRAGDQGRQLGVLAIRSS